MSEKRPALPPFLSTLSLSLILTWRRSPGRRTRRRWRRRLVRCGAARVCDPWRQSRGVGPCRAAAFARRARRVGRLRCVAGGAHVRLGHLAGQCEEDAGGRAGRHEGSDEEESERKKREPSVNSLFISVRTQLEGGTEGHAPGSDVLPLLLWPGQPAGLGAGVGVRGWRRGTRKRSRALSFDGSGRAAVPRALHARRCAPGLADAQVVPRNGAG